MRLEDVAPGQRLTGVLPGEAVVVVAAQPHGAATIELTYKTTAGNLAQRMLFRRDEQLISVTAAGGRPFDADPRQFQLAAEVQRMSMAGLFDPMLAVATSDVRPLPHQIRAVYEEMLDRTPLRFLLADDPGAGKTIMAGLYIKELLLREDISRCLVVAPGGLVDQWQDELFLKFGLRFDILSNDLIESAFGGRVFDRHPLLIARMDQLARNERLLADLDLSDWDLVVVDEAHRMAARRFGSGIDKTRRFHLGERLAARTRHLLLMTATPHAGNDDDFRLFLTLLDRDGFEGTGAGASGPLDTTGVMRRMVKEDLLTFEGTPLFPERIAQTVPYQLTARETDLYDQVTEYVRFGMSQAEGLDGKRRNAVGFALTVLQRRLASSPAAIHQSLVRRSQRLERRRAELRAGRLEASERMWPEVDEDEHSAVELEQIQEEQLDEATAARTVAELDIELRDLARLVALAAEVRGLDTDRKWVELRRILEDNLLDRSDGRRRKLIVFTEHRDTLEYLRQRVTDVLGSDDAVVTIHGGVRRSDRRQITERFSKHPQCQVMVATDAAGEGLNLQAAHLMVNYDLPWNPNRIEQRFGRIHRIGQTEVCRLWNIVATGTREGDVFERLLRKVESQRQAYGGKVFDVLGAAFEETPLRDLLIDAIRYGDDPAVQRRMEEVLDRTVAHGLPELLRDKALTEEAMRPADLARVQERMVDARARRLEPRQVEWAFRHAFQTLGGRLVQRERGRFEIAEVPAPVLAAAGTGPVAKRYSRVTFSLEHADGPSGGRADLLAPGHPLHDAVTAVISQLLAGVLSRGTVLASPAVEAPTLLIGVVEEVVDGTEATVSRRFGYAFADASGQVRSAGPAPHLDCLTDVRPALAAEALRLPWLASAETEATRWIIEHQLQDYLSETAARVLPDVRRTRSRVEERLTSESRRLRAEAGAAAAKERAGTRPAESADSLRQKSQELEERLRRQLASLAAQAQLSIKPPRLVSAALVLPQPR